jgi:asparagine synthase (glutamine-hydrolysing)
MCGLAGFFESGRRFPADLLAGVEADLAHRGPDSGGQVSEPGWALAFRRLAIMDPGHDSDQPMSDESGRCTLVFNGEIYNFRTLRSELESVGVHFHSHGDTEVLLQGYLQWGLGVLDRLEGMYAFILIDRKQNVAVAARDPFGIKPLYLCAKGSCVALASEMRPLYRLIEPKPDEVALAEILTFKWAASGLSNIKGIERVPGGTVLTIPLDGGPMRRRKFFDVLSTIEPDESITARDAEAQSQEAIEQSVRAHLMSDVGYALQLSGGVDSSLVAAVAAEAAGRRVASFSVSLGNHRFDEGQYRKPVVERYGLDHHEVEIDGHAFADALPRAIRHMEGTVPHGACVTLMLLCDRLRATSKVVLTGEGADEMFGGYMRYGLWRKLALQEWLGALVPKALLPAVWPFRGLRQLAGRDAAVYATVFHDFPLMHDLFPDMVPKPGAREQVSARFSEFRDRLFAVDQVHYLESLLVRQDKMSMAASVEARVPFVHLPLARLVNKLPRAIRAPGGDPKPLLKRIAEKYLDRPLIYRRKIGLWLPYDEWLSDSQGLGRYLDLVAAPDGRLRAFARPNGLERVVERFRQGDRKGLPYMWTLVNAEMWLRSLSERPQTAQPKAAAYQPA